MQRRRFNALIAAVPFSAPAWAEAGWEDLRWRDPARERELPLRIRWPAGDAPCALVVFSHGLGGNLQAGSVWAEAWQAAGFAVLNLQHPGSDDSIWKDGLRGARGGAQVDQYLARVADARFVLDELARRRGEPGWGRVRMDALGFSGHSFGARLTQALAGESLPGRRGARSPLADPRPRAFIGFSPGFNARSGDVAELAKQHFAAVDRPFLCLTGTRDDAMVVGDATNAARRAVFDGLPAGAKAELVLDGADHMTFGGQSITLRARRGPLARAESAVEREPVHREIVARVTSDWWRWRLLGDDAARDRLRAPAGLAVGDRWRIG